MEKKKAMGGWKTWAGAVLLAAAAVLRAVGQEEIATAAMTLGGALGLVGIGHKIEKASV